MHLRQFTITCKYLLYILANTNTFFFCFFELSSREISSFYSINILIFIQVPYSQSVSMHSQNEFMHQTDAK